MDLATEEDIECGLLEWTKLFKAETWEEIKMLAEKDKYIAEAAKTVWGLSQEQIIRLQCAAREDLEKSRRKELRNIELMKDEIVELKEILSEKDAKIAELEALLLSMQ